MERIKVLFSFLVLVFLLFGIGCKEKDKENITVSKHILINKEGKPIPLPKDKLIFVNFMAYSCSSCMKELPVIKKVLSSPKYKDKFAFIGCVIDADKDDLTDKNFPFYSCNKANFVRFPVPGTPTTYVITPQGKKLLFIFGAVTEENLKKFLDEALRKYEKINKKDI